MLLLAMVAMAEPVTAGQSPAWTEYEIEMAASENRQPTMIIRWFSDQVPGAACEYPEIWRAGMTFGMGKRFKVAALRGVNKDGFQTPGKTVEVSVLDTVTKKTIQFSSVGAKIYQSYSAEWAERRRNASANDKSK